MNNRPTIKEIQEDYKKYLIKLKGDGLCFLAKNIWGEIALVNKMCITTKNNFCIMELDSSLYNYFDENFVACAIRKFDNEIEPISYVAQNKEPEEWDWTEDDAEEMTLAEVCKALGKKIKIVEEEENV